jgi:branched-chain amino acid transport system ATP-binding protein
MAEGESIMNVLEVENVSQSFGGLKVLMNVSFRMEAGERVGLIGPNGAGKTTLLNVLSGHLACQNGRIHLLGQEVTHMPSYGRISLGLARSFQVNTLFPNLSLLNNVLLAVQGTKPARFQMLRSITAYGDNFARAKELLELVGLWEKRDDLITAVSHGEQRQVEILLALASEPKLLMLDEPSAGLSAAETAGFIDMMRGLTAGITLFFCAHDMEVLFALAERVMVLYYGGIIAQGTPEEIKKDPKVREIYLGMQGESA